MTAVEPRLAHHKAKIKAQIGRAVQAKLGQATGHPHATQGQINRQGPQQNGFQGAGR